MKKVRDLSAKELADELLKRRYDAGIENNIYRLALKWLRFEQEGIDAVIDELNINREDIQDNAYYHEILHKIVEASQRPEEAPPHALDWEELIELLDALKYTAELERDDPDTLSGAREVYAKEVQGAEEWINQLTVAFGPFSGYEDHCAEPEKPEQLQGVFQWVYTGDGERKKWSCKKVSDDEVRPSRTSVNITIGEDVSQESLKGLVRDLRSAIEDRDSGAPGYDIDTPTLKKCGTRFIAEISGGSHCFDLKRVVDLEVDGECIRLYDRRGEHFELLLQGGERDIRSIQTAWLELGRTER